MNAGIWTVVMMVSMAGIFSIAAFCGLKVSRGVAEERAVELARRFGSVLAVLQFVVYLKHETRT